MEDSIKTGATNGGAPSTLVRDELFTSASPDFVPYLRRFESMKVLAAFADRWRADPRPEARDLIRQYTLEPLNATGHEPIVKRLFKHAESTGDHEAVAWWAAAFDRLIRRKRATQWHWDPVQRESYSTIVLQSLRNRTIPNALYPERPKYYWNSRPVAEQRLFSYATRHYLNRRAWRYLRQLGYSDAEGYLDAMTTLLSRYRDEDLGQPENLLDSRTLMHACFHGSDVLEFTPRFVKIQSCRSLSELKAAPYHAEHWQRIDAFDRLLDLLDRASSGVVLVFSLDLIERHHAQLVSTIDPERLLCWMRHSDARLQSFASSAFAACTRLGSLGLDVWLRLLDDPLSPFIAEIVAAFEKHVEPGRLDLSERIGLLQASPTSVAELGLRLVQEHDARQPLDRTQLASVAAMRSGAVARRAADWALRAESERAADAALTLEFQTVLFDAGLLPVRRAAMEALKPDSRVWNEPEFWTRLVESPHDDVRFGLLERLEERGAVPGNDTSGLEALWTSVVLGVHRGSRWKPRALEQIVDAIAARPDQDRTDGLISVIALAIRSIRGPERRSGLSAMARLLAAAPDLEPRVQRIIPELGFRSPDAGPDAGPVATSGDHA